MWKWLKKRNNKITEDTVIQFYAMQEKFNKISDVTGVISINFKQLCKKIDKTYDLSYRIIKNEATESIVIVRDDYIKKYIIIHTLDDIINTNIKFGRYI